jgi:hypothetical protein
MTKKKVLLAAASLLAVFLLGCPQQKKIGDITREPQRYVNKDIVVQGTVTNSIGALVAGVYEVDDGTGKMWVVSNGGVPSKGSRVAARGQVEPTFSFGGRSFATVLRERERKYR